MTQLIEDPQSQPEAAPDDRPDHPTGRRRRPVALAVIAVIVVVMAALAVRSATSTTPAAKPFAPGTTIPVVLQCGGADAACVAATNAPDGSPWIWATGVGETIPAKWVDGEISGAIHIESEWGAATFVAGDQSITVQGGKSTPGHSFFG